MFEHIYVIGLLIQKLYCICADLEHLS